MNRIAAFPILWTLSFASAQTPSGLVLRGRTVDASGSPLPTVTITLHPSGAGGQGSGATTMTAVSDARGSFSFEGPAPGTYLITGRRMGYLDGSPGARYPGGPGIPVALTADAKTLEVQLTLASAPKISGRVIDEDGDPMPGIRVEVFAITSANGILRLQQSGNTVSNSRGSWTITNLKPGRYFVRAGDVPSVTRPAMPAYSATARHERYLASWYPGVTDLKAATLVHAKANQDVAALDIRMREVRTYDVDGALGGQVDSLALGQKIVIAIVPADSEYATSLSDIVATAEMEAGYSFHLTGVPSGDHQLMALDVSGAPHMIARQRIAVGTSDIGDMRLNLRPQATINGVVRLEDGGLQSTGSTTQTPDKVPHVGLISNEGVAGVFGGVMSGDWSFAIASVPPGVYRLALLGGPDGAWVKSTTLDGHEVKDGAVTVSGGTQTLELVLSTKGAQIFGNVQTADGKPAPLTPVTLRQDTTDGATIPVFRSQPADEAGAFSFKSLAPGTYRLFAMDDPDTSLLLDPEFQKVYGGTAKTVSIREGVATSVTLTETHVAER